MSVASPLHGGVSLASVIALADAVSDVVMITTADLDAPGPTIVHVNPAFTRVTGYAADEVRGKTPRLLQGPNTDRAELDRMRRELHRHHSFFGQVVNYTKQGDEFVFAWNISPLRDERGQVSHWISVQRARDAAMDDELQRFRVLIVGSGDAVPTALRHAVSRMSSHAVVHDVVDGGQALRLAAELADLDLLVVAGPAAGPGNAAQIMALRATFAEVPIVVLATHASGEDARAARDAGADAYIAEPVDEDLLTEVLRFVRAGGAYLSWQVVAPAPRSPKLADLTRRQRQIARLLAAGLSNRQVAEQLGLSVNTVKGHVARTMKALGATNRTQVALLFKSDA